MVDRVGRAEKSPRGAAGVASFAIVIAGAGAERTAGTEAAAHVTSKGDAGSSNTCFLLLKAGNDLTDALPGTRDREAACQAPACRARVGDGTVQTVQS
ncbi:hypothetical protein ABGN05_20765 [Aquibium sp. LZ166]|uniref:Uncharacterized protein n=1 Tax=Aquibium pacificus TaxID=3153579 RepID=A0ABV3SRB8_9HYPH